MVRSGQSGFSTPPFTAGGNETGSSDHAHRISGGYTFGGTTVGLVYERLKYRNKGVTAALAMQSYERDMVYASVEHKFANAHRVRLAYGQTTRIKCSVNGGGCPDDSLGARMFAVGYAYDFSRRTQ